MLAQCLLGGCSAVVALVMNVLFFVYFLCVQINATAYLGGKGSAIVIGTKPPVPIDSGAAATADIPIGLVIEAFTALRGSVGTGGEQRRLLPGGEVVALVDLVEV